jgi:hypothetical protein
MPATDLVDLDDPDAIIARLIELDEQNKALNVALRAVIQRQQAEARLRLPRSAAPPRPPGEGAAEVTTACHSQHIQTKIKDIGEG